MQIPFTAPLNDIGENTSLGHESSQLLSVFNLALFWGTFQRGFMVVTGGIRYTCLLRNRLRDCFKKGLWKDMNNPF